MYLYLSAEKVSENSYASSSVVVDDFSSQKEQSDGKLNDNCGVQPPMVTLSC